MIRKYFFERDEFRWDPGIECHHLDLIISNFLHGDIVSDILFIFGAEITIAFDGNFELLINTGTLRTYTQYLRINVVPLNFIFLFTLVYS